MTHFCMRNYGLQKLLHGTQLTEINDVINDCLLFLTLWTVDTTRLKAQAPSVRFVTLFVANLIV